MPQVDVFTYGPSQALPPGLVEESPAPFIAQKTYAQSSNPADKPNGPTVIDVRTNEPLYVPIVEPL